MLDSGQLEEYLREVERRAQPADQDGDVDVFAQLAQREADLVLAAELGKALLEKNEQISRTNERLAEEYSHKLEALEQEKHGLRRRLDVLEGEAEGRAAELQGDLRQARRELALQQAAHQAAGRERSALLDELTEQNHRLTAELKQAAHKEDQLQKELQSLREQFNVRRSNLHDHVSQLEGLREEITLLSERKWELERRLGALSDERAGLSESLEESSDRILLLERRAADQDQQIRLQQRDMDELRQTNSHLQSRLDVVLRRCGTPTAGGGASLLDEMEMSSQSSVEEDLRSPSQCGRSRVSDHPVDYLDDEIECDDSDLPLAPMDTEDVWKIREDLVPVYRQLRRLCEELRQRGRDPQAEEADSGLAPSPEELRPVDFRVSRLADAVRQLTALVRDVLHSHPDSVCSSCQSVAEDRDSLEKMEKELLEKNEEVKRKSEEVSQLVAKVTVQEAELSAQRETCEQLRSDLDGGALAKDQVVKKAWEVRDQAVARKNAVEIELARTRIDVMHINSQLMEAVQQKVELSQQLEQWQMDMEILLDKQVTKKLKTQEKDDRKSKDPQTKPPAPSENQSSKVKLFRLWR